MNSITTFLVHVDKKLKFAIQAFVISLLIYLVSSNTIAISVASECYVFIIILAIGTFIIHFPNITFRNAFYTVVMPCVLVSGALLSLSLFPNLGAIFRVFVIFGYGILYYLISLMDNIFLVVHDRSEMIPLYRVAATWSMILGVVAAIPLFSGIFRASLNAVYQNGLVGMIAFVLNIYQLHVYSYDPDAKRVRVGEGFYLSLITTFFVLCGGIGVSFMATEPFLRSMFVSGVLMFGLNYTSAYLKNETSKKILFQYFLIIFAFLLVLLFFIP